MTLPTKDLHAIGEYLYGEWWQSPLSRRIDVSIRTMQRWASGAWVIKEGASSDLIAIAAERWCETIIICAAKNGLWGSKTLSPGAPPVACSAETALAIQQKVFELLKEIGIVRFKA